jgi:protein-S-isoprenylcysteine O-methyltransferase Ste14
MPTVSGARCADGVLLAALACVIGLGLTRAVLLYARGVHVVVVDRQRSPAQTLGDLTQVICLLLWAYAVVAYAWPLSAHLIPAWLGTVVIDSVWAEIAGAVMLVASVLVYGAALRALGNSWRLGIDRDRPGALVTGGIFAWTRHPIYVSLDLLIVGSVLVQGRLILLLLALLNVGLFHQLMLREERFLTTTYGEAYRDYCGRVRRYVLW